MFDPNTTTKPKKDKPPPNHAPAPLVVPPVQFQIVPTLRSRTGLSKVPLLLDPAKQMQKVRERAAALAAAGED